jgi:hypothetical protein
MILALVFGGAFLYEAAQSKLTEYFALHPELLPSIEYYLTLDWLGIGAFVLACGPILMYCVAFRPPLGELRWPHLRHGWLGPAHTELKRTTSASLWTAQRPAVWRGPVESAPNPLDCAA